MVHGSLQAIGPGKYPFDDEAARRSDHWVETAATFRSFSRAISQKNNHEKALGVARGKRLPSPKPKPLRSRRRRNQPRKQVGQYHPRKRLDELAKAQAALQQANRGKGKGLDKTNKQKDKDAKTQALAQAKQNHLSHSNAHNDWKNRANFRSEQVSALHEAHRKAEEAKERNKDDTGFQDALAKQREALTAMEKAFGQARDSANRHKGKWTSMRSSSNPRLRHLPRPLRPSPRQAKPGPSSGKVLASDKSLKDATSRHAQAKTARDQAQASLDSSRKALAAAREALKGPTAELEKAKRNFEASTQDVSRWQAELVNVERHVELNNLRGLESELGELKDLLTEAEGFRNSAMQAVQAASESLRLVPEKITQAEKLVQDKQGKVRNLETNKSNRRSREKKAAFIKNVDQLAVRPRKKPKPSKAPSLLRRMPNSRNHRPSETGSFQYE